MKAGQTVVLADAAGLVQAFDVVSLEPIAELSLGSPPASDIWKLEDRYFVETSDGRLTAFEVTPEARIVWNLALQQGEYLLGPPLSAGENGGSILIASVDGSVVQINQDTGKVQSRTQLSQSLQLPLRRFGESILATFVDGTATLLDVGPLTVDQAAE